jgi:hypothetical protein
LRHCLAAPIFAPITKKVAKTLLGHRKFNLNYFRGLKKQFSNSVIEGLNTPRRRWPTASPGLAVLRLMTNSNLVDCTTGRSAGLVPFHYDIQPTLPERLYELVQQLERKGQKSSD